MGSFRGWEIIILLALATPFIIAAIAIITTLRKKPQAPTATPAGWYPDPTNPELVRYWDGTQWTNNTTETDDAD